MSVDWPMIECKHDIMPGSGLGLLGVKTNSHRHCHNIVERLYSNNGPAPEEM